MKMNLFKTRLMASALICLQVGFHAAQAQEEASVVDFPYAIPLELGASGFAPGDGITISSLRGDRAHLQPDGTYLVQGSYTLASADSAQLLFSCTTRGTNGQSTLHGPLQLKISRGSGTFSLIHPPCDGLYHLSFYVANEHHSHGGVYFGEKGFEKTVLRKSDWPDFSESPASSLRGQVPGTGGNAESILSSDSNQSIMAYLGKPIPAPVDLDAKYTPTNLLTAFTNISQKAGWRIQTLLVDHSEFPFLLYGVLAGEHHIEESDIRAIKGYNYGGSVVAREEGSTYFALNMIPNNQYPSGQTKACNRRLIVRLQMLADTAHSQ
jgi:hypothetical protein